MEVALAVERLGRRAECPAVLQHQGLDDSDANDVIEALQLAEDERAVRPGAGERPGAALKPELPSMVTWSRKVLASRMKAPPVFLVS
jgi:hypothetical protein